MNTEKLESITINPVRMLAFLLGAICLLLVFHLIGQGIRFQYGLHDSVLIKVFNLGSEGSIPTIFVTMEWLICVVLLGYIAIYRKQLGSDHLRWAILAILFMFLTLDEVLTFHESISYRVRDFLGTSGLLRFAWIIPYSLFVVVLAAFYWRFIFNLSPVVRRLFVLSAIIFLTGAVGVEALEGLHVERNGNDSVYYLLYISFEESLEMTGLAVFIYSLYMYLNVELGVFRISIYSFRELYALSIGYIKDCFTKSPR